MYAKKLAQKQNFVPLATVGQPNQEANHGGGFSYIITPLDRLTRILILGSEKTYYQADEEQNVLEHIEAMREIITNDFHNAVMVINSLNTVTEGRPSRVVRKSGSIFALAVAATIADDKSKQDIVRNVLSFRRVVSTLRQMYDFVYNISVINGGGKVKLKKWIRFAIAEWLNGMKNPAQQIVKYRSASYEGQKITAKDLIRLTHPKPQSEVHDAVFAYATSDKEPSLEYIREFEILQSSKDHQEIIAILNNGAGHTWEEVPNTWFTETHKVERSAIWKVLSGQMGSTALIRNIRRFQEYGLLDWDKPSPVRENIEKALENVVRDRVHPIQVFQGLQVASNQRLQHALNDGMQRAFGQFKVLEQNILVGVDVSGSMALGEVVGMKGCAPIDAEAFMLTAMMHQFVNYEVMAFSDTLTKVNVTKGDKYDAVQRELRNRKFSDTSIGLLIDYAIKNRTKVDLFVVMTDNEVNAGSNSALLLERYRRDVNTNAKVVVIGFTATRFSAFNSDVPGVLNIAGLDAATMQLIADFAEGTL